MLLRNLPNLWQVFVRHRTVGTKRHKTQFQRTLCSKAEQVPSVVPPLLAGQALGVGVVFGHRERDNKGSADLGQASTAEDPCLFLNGSVNLVTAYALRSARELRNLTPTGWQPAYTCIRSPAP